MLAAVMTTVVGNGIRPPDTNQVPADSRVRRAMVSAIRSSNNAPSPYTN